MNDIISLLNLEDTDIEIESVEKIGTTKTVTLFTRPKPHYCLKCGYLMHSRGVKIRTINHPVLQDSYHLIVKLKQRRWRRTNQNCRFDEAEEFEYLVTQHFVAI